MHDLNLGLSKEQFGITIPETKSNNELIDVGSIDANKIKIKNISFILRTNEDKEPTIKIGEGYFWYRGEKIEDTKNVYELFADFLQKQRCNY